MSHDDALQTVLSIILDDSLDAEDMARLRRAREYAEDVLKDVEASPKRGALKRDLNDNESMLAWAVDYLSDVIEGMKGVNLALRATPPTSDAWAALQWLCDLKRMKMALEEQSGDELTLPGGAVKRADIQRYYDQNKEAAWRQGFDALASVQNDTTEIQGSTEARIKPPLSSVHNGERASPQAARQMGQGQVQQPVEARHSPQSERPARKTAKQEYDEHTKGETLPPIQALRFFCSLAMNGQDWLDVEPFFEALRRKVQPQASEAAVGPYVPPVIYDPQRGFLIDSKTGARVEPKPQKPWHNAPETDAIWRRHTETAPLDESKELSHTLKQYYEMAAHACQMERQRNALRADGGSTKPDEAEALAMYRRLYHELLYQVANKHPGETRHQTALRYIQQAERGETQASGCSVNEQADGGKSA